MIVGSLKTVVAQVAQQPNILAALAYLQALEPASIQDGRYTIAASKVDAIFQSYPTQKLPETLEVEGHRKFIDIYLMLEGTEQVGWIARDRLVDIPEYDEVRDVWTKMVEREALSFVTLQQGDVAILFPEDVHAAQVTEGIPAPTRKVVLKVAV